MATVDAKGDLQLEPEDIIPLEVAYRTDDPDHIRRLIDDLNKTIKTSDDLAKAVADVDAERRKWREKQGLPPEESLAEKPSES